MADQVPAPETPTPTPVEQPTVNPFTEELSAPLINPETVQPTDSQQPNIETPIQPIAPKNKRSNWLLKNKIWILITMLTLVLAGGGAVYFVKHKNAPKSSAANTTTTKPAVTTSPTVTSTIQSYTVDASTGLVTIPSQTYNLLNSAQPIADPSIVNDYNAIFGINNNCGYTGAPSCSVAVTTKPASVNFYKIGTIASGQSIIVIDGPSQGPGGNTDYLLINDTPDHYIVMGDLSGIDYANSTIITDKAFKSNVVFAKGGIPSEFSFPDTAQINGLKLTIGYQYQTNGKFSGLFMSDLGTIRGSGITVDTSAISDLGTFSGLKIRQTITSDKPTFSLKEIDLTINDMFSATYKIDDKLLGVTAPAITWSDNSKNTSAYVSKTPGCGNGYSYVTVKNIVASQLTTVGTGPDGQTLYQLPNSSPFLLEVYNNDYSAGTNLTDASLQNLTLAQFQAKHGVIIAKNALGEYAAYMRADLFMFGGCGKPVIYLYPTTTTKVSVKVGADVTKSEPTYPTTTGWQSVVAQPNGQLTYQGKQYDSLFWEGFGFGPYPDLQTGTVVAKNKVVSVIKDQLKTQGLNDREIKDFLDFWQPKLPQTPYTLLRWLTSAQMNQLAPLSISPAPNTVIRTFLDFKGLDKPINVAPQTFTSPARNGFTVVEWGGLL